LEEQKETTGLLVGLNSTLNAVQGKIDNLQAKINKDQIGNILYEKSEQDDQLIKELNEMKNLLDNLPRNIRHEKRLLLFPEHNAREYYSVVLKWLLLMIIATYAYCLFRYLITAFAC
jgi:hypothetical protein